MKFKEIQKLDAKYIGPTFGRFPIAFSKGKGCQVWDTEGKVYLDFFSGLAVNALGQAHPAVVKAVKEQADKYLHSSNLYYSETQARLAELLVKNSFADKVYFANTGAEATELCIKLARKHGLPKKRFQIIAMRNSFHGRTFGALSATGQEKFHHGFEPMLPGFVHVGLNDLAAVRKAINSKTCAILLEPIQGEGGIHVASEETLRGLQALCKKHDLLFILDEIQTGLGRTGKLFYYQWLGKGFAPDVMPLAKSLGGGLPLSAVLANAKAAKLLGLGEHGTTMGGNPVACAAGLASIQTIMKPGFLENVRQRGEQFKQGLSRLKSRFDFIKEVRGQGLMLGLELDRPSGPVASEALKQGLLVNATAGNVLRLLPPLVISEAETKRGLEILERVFEKVFAARE